VGKIELQRPIVFFDLETTGLDIKSSKIVEITFIKYNSNDLEEELTFRINPGIPIPSEATEVHGITDEDVVNKPTFSQYAKDFLNFLEGCDLCAYNGIAYDIPLLKEEFKNSGLEFNIENRYIIDPKIIFFSKEPRDLASAYQKYCGKNLENAHQSLGDTRATKEILLSQIKYYPDIGKSAEDLHSFCNPPKPPNWVDTRGKLIHSNEGIVINFGKKHGGKLLNEVIQIDPSWVDFIIQKSDLDEDVKNAIQEAKKNF
tara:strand:+ start:182 stop:955 length:774 start_codon:yes stop_codon:yes gene_type:complete